MSGMLINIRGPCGSGKSHLARTLLSPTAIPLMCTGRRYPMGYQSENLVIVGHYENKAMGGADSFKTIDDAYAVAEQYVKQGYCVLIEGKCQERDTEHVLRMCDIGKVWALHLITPLHQCITSVRNRASANAIRDENIARSFRKAEHDAQFLAENGVHVLRLTRGEALALVKHFIVLHRRKENAPDLYS